MLLDSHFAPTVYGGGGYSPRYLHSVSHVVRQDPHRFRTRHWGQMTWEFLLSRAVHYPRQVQKCLSSLWCIRLMSGVWCQGKGRAYKRHSCSILLAGKTRRLWNSSSPCYTSCMWNPRKFRREKNTFSTVCLLLIWLMSGRISFFSDSLDGCGHHSNFGFPWQVTDAPSLPSAILFLTLWKIQKKWNFLDLCLG